jgi:hypothetical protein
MIENRENHEPIKGCVGDLRQNLEKWRGNNMHGFDVQFGLTPHII